MENKDNIHFGFIEPIEVGILQIINLLSKDKIYKNLPLQMIDRVLKPIQLGHYYCAIDVEHKQCVGVLIFIRISTDTAKLCIEEKREPTIYENDADGKELFIIAIAGQSIFRLFRNFCLHHRGELILYKRHIFENKKIITHFGYIDRDGKKSKL